MKSVHRYKALPSLAELADPAVPEHLTELQKHAALYRRLQKFRTGRH